MTVATGALVYSQCYSCGGDREGRFPCPTTHDHVLGKEYCLLEWGPDLHELLTGALTVQMLPLTLLQARQGCYFSHLYFLWCHKALRGAFCSALGQVGPEFPIFAS